MTIPHFEIRTLEHVPTTGRNVIFNVWTAPVHHVALYQSPLDTVGGNHYHPDSTEITFLVSGLYELVVQHRRLSSPPEKHIIKPGQLVIIGPNIGHALHYLEHSVMIGLSDKPKRTEEYKQNTIPLEIKLIEPMF